MDRREALSKLAAAGAVGATGALVASSPAFACPGSICTAQSSYVFIPTGGSGNFTPSPRSCRAEAGGTKSVCRATATTRMLLSRNAAGTMRPFFDEVGWVRVVSPCGVERNQNFLGYQPDCKIVNAFTVADAPEPYNLGGTGGTGPTPAKDITALFGTETGIFTVTVEVRNRYSPFGYSAVYVVPN